ncbi:MAG TPA: hypothetical protein VLM76_05225 [Patescibacteria group bacterium]|nr:hypothetical protein [Patescibacteria group bacterium]
MNTSPQQRWSVRTFSWTLAGVELPAGAQVEVRIGASGGTPDLEIACDTTGQPSALTLAGRDGVEPGAADGPNGGCRRRDWLTRPPPRPAAFG